ncbi:hypothetical protein Gohar_028001 [Gossypium harknessii]|uniref:Uncharacterized protein n=1 Tax=Gossypium harknessii TaxID=34285 RepID=A0A7J9I8E2_9ROSI|nr:hypothetical protein [Gossypium harknessii]
MVVLKKMVRSRLRMKVIVIQRM